MIYTIERKMSGTGSIHDLASDLYDREITFGPGCQYAVVCASYYGGKGYTTHKTMGAAIAASRRLGEYSHQIIDRTGHTYSVYGDELRLDSGQVTP